jgi:protein-disulfide isomerase
MTTHHATHGGSTKDSPWFLGTICLLTFILGYGVATGVNSRVGGAASAPAGQAAPAARQPAAAVDDSKLTPASVDDDFFIGQANAPITIVEFSDYECPFCKRFHTQTFAELKKEYIDTGKVRLVHRDYPLPFHKMARPMAMAVECAQDQGNAQAVAMHEAMFDGQEGGKPTVELIKQWGKAVSGLDVATWESCFDSNKHDEEISKDMKDGSASGVTGTPGFWILGPNDQRKRLKGAQPFNAFKSEIDAMLAK